MSKGTRGELDMALLLVIDASISAGGPAHVLAVVSEVLDCLETDVILGKQAVKESIELIDRCAEEVYALTGELIRRQKAISRN